MNRKKMRLMPWFCTLANRNSFSECTHCCVVRFVAENWKRFFTVSSKTLDINNSLRKHKHNNVEEYSCNLLETAECKFFPRFLDKNRRIHNDRWRMNKSTSIFWLLFCLFLFAGVWSHAVWSLNQFSSTFRHCLFVFISFPKKIYDLSVSMVLETVYQK